MLRSASRWIATATALGSLVVLGTAPVGANAAGLPDHRAYELVSPPDKNGGDVMAETSRIRVADDGSAVSFSSLAGFGDTRGSGVAADYLSVRTGAQGTNGWATHGVTPVQEPLTLQEVIPTDPAYVGDFSEDLNRAVFRGVSPLTNAPGVAAVTNFYRRNDLRRPGAGSYELISPCLLCDSARTALPPLPAIAPGFLVPAYAGASADFETVAFESRFNLTTDAPPQPVFCARFSVTCLTRLYVWDHGQLRLAGLVPSGTDIACGGADPPCVAAPASIAGQGAGAQSGGINPYRPLHIVSADGSKVFFTVPSDATSSASLQSGNLYVRTNHATTALLNASERTDCAGDPTCGGDGTPDPAPGTPGPASYWTASADGTRAFFTTGEALTDDAPGGGDKNLYMYDTTKPASDPHNLTYINVDHERGDAANDLTGVIGASDDGRFVYFITNGQLVDGQPPLRLGRGIFMWHDGDLAYVGDVLDPESGDLLTTGFGYTLTTPQARVTPDGRHLLLSTHDGSGFSPGYDQGGHRELYVYSADTRRVVCASCVPGGGPATTDAFVASRTNASVSASTWHLNHPITSDGMHVFFTTGDALVPEDTNGKNDAYEYDLATATSAATVHLISSGTDKADSYFMDASPSGNDVYFLTRGRLVGWDTDTSYDLYDARVGGGFPDPARVAPGCSGAACQGQAGLAPSTPPVGSTTFDGAGDVAGSLRSRTTKPSCKKGFVKRRVGRKHKCVRRARARHKHAAKRAVGHQRRSK